MPLVEINMGQNTGRSSLKERTLHLMGVGLTLILAI